MHIGADGHIELEPDNDLIVKVGTTEYVRFDGSTQRVGIGTTSPDAPLHVKHTGNGDTLILESTDAPAQDNDMAPNLVLLRSGIPAASTNTDAGKIQFKALDSDGGTTRLLGHIQSEFNTATGSSCLLYTSPSPRDS